MRLSGLLKNLQYYAAVNCGFAQPRFVSIKAKGTDHLAGAFCIIGTWSRGRTARNDVRTEEMARACSAKVVISEWSLSLFFCMD
ncbi:hypothetical protein BK127_13195 [Paenibacillus sp. FSL H7-0331]|nr:hypothetical protein BK127_13195 [Paenibacillus sp. FSL H7-0331]